MKSYGFIFAASAVFDFRAAPQALNEKVLPAGVLRRDCAFCVGSKGESVSNCQHHQG